MFSYMSLTFYMLFFLKLLEYILDCLRFLLVFVYLYGLIPSLTIWIFVELNLLDTNNGIGYSYTDILLIVGWLFLWVLLLLFEVGFVYIIGFLFADTGKTKKLFSQYW